AEDRLEGRACPPSRNLRPRTTSAHSCGARPSRTSSAKRCSPKPRGVHDRFRSLRCPKRVVTFVSRHNQATSLLGALVGSMVSFFLRLHERKGEGALI